MAIALPGRSPTLANQRKTTNFSARGSIGAVCKIKPFFVVDLCITHFSLRSPYLIPVDNCELCMKFGEVALFNCNLAVTASSPLSTGI